MFAYSQYFTSTMFLHRSSTLCYRLIICVRKLSKIFLFEPRERERECVERGCLAHYRCERHLMICVRTLLNVFEPTETHHSGPSLHQELFTPKKKPRIRFGCLHTSLKKKLYKHTTPSCRLTLTKH